MTRFLFSRERFRNFASRLRSRAPVSRLVLQSLEDRCVPATFHVALTGNDLTGDGSIAAPFRTIQKGITEAAATADGNDFVDVAGGTYATPVFDLAITIPANGNLTNLQLLGGWDAAFTTQNPVATPTVYVFQNAGSPIGDLNIVNPNTTINGFTWVFDGQAGAGAPRTDSVGLKVQATNAVITNNQFEISPRTVGQRPTAVETTSTDVTGLQVTGNTFSFDAAAPNSTSAAVGIFINPDTGGRTTPLVIDGNTFTGDNLGSAITVSTASNVNFINNRVTRTGTSNTFLSLVDLRQSAGQQTDINIAFNDLVNQSPNATVGAGILTNGANFGAPTNTLSATFLNNNITGNGSGLAVDSLAGSTIVAHNNSFTGNGTGVFKSGATVIDATSNWWGDISGPTVASNPGGTGQSITGPGADSVNYVPWLLYSPDTQPAVPGVQRAVDLFIDGTAGNDRIAVTIRNATQVVVKMNGTELSVTPLADITGRITVLARGGNDQVTIASNVPIPAAIFGGPNNDKLIGGQGNDFLDGGLGADTVQGGRGNDTLVGSTNTEVLAGQGDFDTLLGRAGSPTWTINGGGAGNINGSAKFNTVEQLVGGADNDTFRFVGSGSIKGTIDGGAGINQLNYLKIGGLTVINLSIGTATRTGGVANIRDVVGGNGPSVIVGDSQNNVLVGNGGRDLLIGGGGIDALTGGDGDDILIGGTTSYDASNTALKTLINEWKGTATYEIRIARLMRGRAGGLNLGNSLTTLTVASDGLPNVLDGGAGRDWFFKSPQDLIPPPGPDANETVTDL